MGPRRPLSATGAVGPEYSRLGFYPGRCVACFTRGARGGAAARDKRLADPSPGTGRSAAAHCWSPHGHALLNWLPTLGSRLWRCGQAARDELTHYWHFTLVRQLLSRRKEWLVGAGSAKQLEEVAQRGRGTESPAAKGGTCGRYGGCRRQHPQSASRQPIQNAAAERHPHRVERVVLSVSAPKTTGQRPSHRARKPRGAVAMMK